MLHIYDYFLLRMSNWCSKHVEENNILWIKNNNQCVKLVINYSQFMMHGQENIKLKKHKFYLKFCKICGQESNMSLIFHVNRFHSESCRLCTLFARYILLVGLLTFIYKLLRSLLNFRAYNLVSWIFRQPLLDKSKLSGQNLSPCQFLQHKS